MKTPVTTNLTPSAGRILAGARLHFFAHGWRRVSMEALAKELGVSKKTFYVHFPTKLALIEAVLASKLDEVDADLARLRLEHAGNPVRGLNELMAGWRRHISEVRPGFLRDLQRETPELFKRFSARRRQLVNRHFGGMIEEGRMAGAMRGDLPPGFVAEVLLAAADTMGRPEKIEELQLTPRELFSQLTSVLIEGILTGKGRRRWAACKARSKSQSPSKAMS
jgi:AcrR family transcriptional regulator